MHIFNPKNPCGRLEFFALHLMMGIVLFVIMVWVAQSVVALGDTAGTTFTPIETTTGETGEPVVVGGAPVAAASDAIREFLFAGVSFIAALAIGTVLSFLLVLRRLTDLGASWWLSLLPLAPSFVTLTSYFLVDLVSPDLLATTILMVSLGASVFQLWLLFGKGKDKALVAPYGSNPYDPASWVPPSHGPTANAVTFQGRQLHLPGEQHDEAA